jgi:5-methylcytosine-specific restriction endonuclease McrA
MSAAPVLQFPTLVLNRHWTPLEATTCKEAIALVAKGSARIVDPVTYEVHDLDSWHAVSKAKEHFSGVRIRSMLLSLVPPEVIVLTHYSGDVRRSVVFSRRNLFKRDRCTCQYCGARPGIRNVTIDHILPRSQGGTSTWENCVIACINCNSRKGGRTPDEAGMRLLKRPRRPSWQSLVADNSPPQSTSWRKFLDRAYWEVELQP